MARVDFYIPALNVVIEFDGQVKYSSGDVNSTEETLIKEQAREKRLKNMYLDILRFQWRDVIDGACIETLRDFAVSQQSRIAGGGLVFSDSQGRCRESELPYAVRKLRERRIHQRARRRSEQEEKIRRQG